jgi:HlyD family secretion protein
MKKTLILVAVLAVALLAAGLFWWKQHEKRETGALELHGNIDIRQVSLAFDGSGRVAELLAEEGTAVKAGTVLARLDVRTLRLQADQARAQSEVQQQNLLRIKHGSRPEEIAQARSRVTASQADAARAREELVRLQNIATATQGRGVSPQDLDRAKSAEQIAAAKANEQGQALRMIERGPRNEDVAAAEAQLKASQAQLVLLQHQIDLGELKAPADAVVRSRLLEAGDMATPQRPVFALALSGPKWVRVYVSEPDLGRVRPGMAVKVTTDSARGQVLPAQIAFVSPVAEFTPKSVQTEELRTSLVYEVRVRIDDPADVLRMGQPATVQLANNNAAQ